MSDEEPKKEESADHINLRVTDGNAEIYFKIKRSTPLKRLMEAFCKRQGKSLASLKFTYEGLRVEAESTPESLDMEENDVIEAHQAQVGGC